MRFFIYLCIICIFKQVAIGQSQGVTNSQTKLRPNQIRWSPTDATLDSVYIIRADTSTGEPGWYLVSLSGGGNADTTLAGDVVGGLNSTFVRKINGVTVENKTPQTREVLTYNGTQWTPDSIDLADLPTLAQSILLGRGSASTGVPQSISLGTGLSMSGTTLSNSAPDQTVSISSGTGISASGTYPNFTVTNTAPDQTVSITGGGINSVSGNYPSFTVTGTEVDGSTSNEIQTIDTLTVASNLLRLKLSGSAVKTLAMSNFATSPAGSSMQVQYNNAGSFGALDSFTVFVNPDRVGIGVPTPTARLDIQGSGATSATNALRVRNSAGTNLLTVRNDSRIGIGQSAPTSTLDIQGANTIDGLRVHLTGQNPYLAQFYNDYYSSSTAVFQYFAFNSGAFCMGSPSNNIVRLYTTGSGSSYTSPEIELQGNGNLKLMSNGGKIGINLTTPLAGIHNAINTTASTPSMLLSGTGFSGGTATTTKPTFLIEPTGTTSTGWATSGTKLGVNAESGFTGNLLDFQVNGSSQVSISNTGFAYFNGFRSSIIRTNFINNYDNSVTAFTIDNTTARTTFGGSIFAINGTTSSFPALKRNGTGLDVRLADDSGFAPIQSLYDRFGSGSPEGVVAAPVGAVYHRTDGGTGTSLYVKETGTTTSSGWVAK